MSFNHYQPWVISCATSFLYETTVLVDVDVSPGKERPVSGKYCTVRLFGCMIV